MVGLSGCPICGYPGTDYVPNSFDICDCCGNEFGYDDAGNTHEQLRAEWDEDGCPFWWTAALPVGWDGQRQRAEVGA